MQVDEGIFVVHEHAALVSGRLTTIKLEIRLRRVRGIHRDPHERSAMGASKAEWLLDSIGIAKTAIGILIAHFAGEGYIGVHCFFQAARRDENL